MRVQEGAQAGRSQPTQGPQEQAPRELGPQEQAPGSWVPWEQASGALTALGALVIWVKKPLTFSRRSQGSKHSRPMCQLCPSWGGSELGEREVPALQGCSPTCGQPSQVP